MNANVSTNPNRRLSGLYGESPSETQLVFPLKHTEGHAKIAGNLARVEIIQSFENPFTQAVEAIYTFPLPDEAAVDDMEIKIGDRLIKGSITERQEARKIYQQAKRAGRTTGLLEQERDNIFTQSLANIQPGEQIDVTIRYTDSLKFSGGNYEFVLPMVVGPRYIPGTPIDNSGDTDLVPDATKISPPIMRSGHDINVTVEIDAGLTISNLHSTSHQLSIDRQDHIVRVKLGEGDTIPNKDFILRYQVAGANTQATVLCQSDDLGGHFAVYLIPALTYQPAEIVPKDVVFLIDTSGSQFGDPLRKSQELMRRFINGLNPHDTFTIIDFANTATYLSAVPLANTLPNRSQAIDYIDRLTADGGTELMNGIDAVLNFPDVPSNRLRSIVLMTDGYIGNDREVLATVQQQLKSSHRLYSFGVGSSTNRFLLNRIAEIGRGTCQVVRHDESTEDVAEQFFQHINNPVLTNVQASWEGVGLAPIIYPSILPDLFAQQPLVLCGRKSDRCAGKLTISGIDANGRQYQNIFNLSFEAQGYPAIAQLWGRSHIKDLMQQMFAVETKAGVEAVTTTALTYQLLSQYTAFIAVSDDVRVDPSEYVISMQVPVETPEGVCFNLMPASIEVTECGAFTGAILSRSFRPLTLADTALEPTSASPWQWSNLPEILHDRLEIVSVTGLEPAEIGAIELHLHQLPIPLGFSGTIVFEFNVNNARVGQLVLDRKVSTLVDRHLIQLIKRSILAWKPSPSATGVVRLTLKIKPVVLT